MLVIFPEEKTVNFFLLSARLRLGYLTGPKPLIDQIVLHMQASTLHTSAFTQVNV